MGPESSPDQNLKKEGEETPSPSEARVVQASNPIEQASKRSEVLNSQRGSGTQKSWFSKHAFGIFYGCVVLALCVALGWLGEHVVRSVGSYLANQIRHDPNISAAYRAIDRRAQAQAEESLRRLASGEQGAADLVLSQSDNWTGKTRRTPTADQFLSTAINLSDLHTREAAIQAQLALEGIARDGIGLDTLKRAVGDPRQRLWALWLLGALGNRGVDPVHVAKIIETYLIDPNPRIRAVAVDGLALVGTDETLPMLLDRFRNDPSPVVQERAACDMAQSGMYAHAQRMRAAASLVAWLDDPLLTANQRVWAFQALRDITGASLGSDAAAWRVWWSRKSNSRS
jgi:hypothetical protein